MNKEAEFFNFSQIKNRVILNQQQQKAILHTDGPLLLLAAPGSGKTTTIIMKIGYLIKEKGVNPKRIKAVTFSKASAMDMKERFNSFFPMLPQVDFSTIHSLAFEVIREYFRKTNTSFQLIEGIQPLERNQLTLNKKIILKEIYNNLVGENITDDQLEELMSYTSLLKNKLIPEEHWSTVKCQIPMAEKIVQEYELFKRTRGTVRLVDYDDMLTIANQVFEEDSEFLRTYQQRYDYVLTDESQDTSLVQHAIIEKLVCNHRNLCVVADDDQSIYTWRAADPKYLLDFKQVYPEAVILMMEQNYRSSKDIVDVATQFIQQNKHRYNKQMFTDNPSYQPIQLKRLADYQNQSKYLIREISQLDNYREVAILYRNHSSSISLMNDFDRAGIPVYIKDSNSHFFSHWVVQDILNFMRISYNDSRTDILEKIHTKFNGYITKQQMKDLQKINNKQSCFDNLLQYINLKDYQIKQLQKCKSLFQEMNGMAPLQVIRLIRESLGYEKALEKLSERYGFNLDHLLDILNTLEEIATTLDTMEEFAGRLQYLEKKMKESKFGKNKNVVTFSTLHSSKGLEFTRVYMIDLVEGIIPSKEETRSKEQGKVELIEEAVRLFYVGMTRAKLHLELLSYEIKNGKHVKESRFLDGVRSIMSPKKERKMKHDLNGRMDISSTAIKEEEQLYVGMEIKHPIFGQGEIILLDREKFEIRFEAGVKKMSLKTCLEMGLLEAV
ncbi:ATP-dependent helicase [Heyndrickxia sp. FSL W8-0496]|uniref:ATP-dependent helicase n=1 Tax=Heyndrickxia TaxID=2837504 RepID=UPI0030F69474